MVSSVGTQEPPSSSPSKSPHLPPLFFQLLTRFAMCVGSYQAYKMIPCSPPTSIHKQSQDLKEGEQCSSVFRGCFQRAPCGSSLPGFHMAASSLESHSREWKMAVLCHVGVRREQSGVGRWRCSQGVNQNKPPAKALNFWSQGSHLLPFALHLRECQSLLSAAEEQGVKQSHLFLP